MINSQNVSLTVVGSGIKFVSHLTTEAKVYIEQSEKVLYLLNDPVLKEWIKQHNKNAESLDDLYLKFPLRVDCYRAITEYILVTLRKQIHLCVVLYGHPTVFAQPALDAVKKARLEGYYAKILPGISAEACLFADLLIDPGSCGCQSFEATDFLLRKRRFDPSSHLILWQVSVIGALGHVQNFDNLEGATILTRVLAEHYDLSHIVTLYQAAQYPFFEPVIESFPLRDLPTAKFSRISTLYISPIKEVRCDEAMMRELGLDIQINPG
jgi:tetrapyrrole methylase family protein/MazG family protein